MLDESFLDVALAVEIQMQINGGGLDVVMAQAVLDICYDLTLIEEIYCSGMTKTMDWIDVFEAFRGEGFFEILPADAVYAMSGEFLPPLVDKEPVLIQKFWAYAVFSDIELEEMTGLGLKLYEPKPISLSQDS